MIDDQPVTIRPGGLVTDLMRIAAFCGLAIGASLMALIWIAVEIVERSA